MTTDRAGGKTVRERERERESVHWGLKRD